ncbi:hypothetical protein CFR79_10940 [Komagataeibacter saccharivorans]|uniref:diguanylate cyclase domain-containing protein n=1 Tax=Komagataeibacter saccharivorans TaxID=265959 RepID=UPI000D7B999C|nr:diguanylate cyclase [Komagataeibacter saccharivorans]PYD50097.1 hypothetical protein CFR79_10940 [Komagataeibacter saccharivorans]GBQ38349.1 hypothetical protein AA0614_1313 [Komagataeibacter saccharivorans NRIC 0614]
MLPFLIVVACDVVIELHDYQHAKMEVRAEALRNTQAYANLIADRLNTRFTELDVASAALQLPHTNPATPSPQMGEALRRYLLSRATPYTFNVLAADGETIQWSTAPSGTTQAKNAQTSAADFTPLDHSGNHLLGRIQYRDDTGDAVLPLLVHGDTDEHTGYFFASNYHLDRLLDIRELPANYRRGWSFTPVDTRDGAVLHARPDSSRRSTPTPAADIAIVVASPVDDYPFSVRLAVPESRVRQTYWRHAPSRWGIEALAFGLLLSAVAVTIRRREREQMLQLTRLTEFNSFMAQLNQCISQAKNEEALLQEICDMAIHYAHLKIAFIGRPDENGSIRMLAVAGPAGCMDGVSISVHPDVPEGCGNVGRVWRSGQPIFNASFKNGEHTAPWREWAIRQGVCSNAVLPIHRDGQIWAVLSVYHEQVDVFDDQLQVLLKEIATDISSGLEQLYNRRLQTALLDNSVVGILLVKDRIIQMTNTRVAQMLGLTPDSLVNQSAEMLYADREEFERVGAIYEQLRTRSEVRVAGVRLSRPDGRVMIADFSGVQLSDINGNVSVWTIEDVTSRDVAQRLYHALVNTADAVLQASSDTEMCARACSDLVHDTLFHAVWIGRMEPGYRLNVIARAGEGTDGMDALDLRAMDEVPVPLVAARAWKTEALAYSNDELGEQAQAPWFDFVRRNQWRAVLSTPIWRGGSTWMVITFVSPQPHIFDAQSIALCQRVAHLLGHALDTLDAKQRVEKLQVEESQRARHDPLTGLPNRLALEEYMPLALARARRQGTAVGVSMLDLDDFKLVNDSYGHEAGDVLLQELARRMRAGLRQTDYIARLGGDEFVIIIDDLDPLVPVAQATTVLDQLHVAVESPFQVTPESRAVVGMTLGLALYPLDGEDPDTLLRRADAAMYQSKVTKATRKTWWCLASATVARPPTDNAPETIAFDAYGPEAAELLTRARSFLARIRHDFMERFDDLIGETPDGKRILSVFTAEELAHLKEQQLKHLGFLLAPETTRQDIVAIAGRIGTVHALSGLTPTLLSESYSIYRRLLIDRLDKAMLRASEQYHILLTTEIRIQDDKGAQLQAGQVVEQTYFSLLSENLPVTDRSLTDATAQEMEDFGQLPGIQAAMLFRASASGQLVVTGTGGPQAQKLGNAMLPVLAQPITEPDPSFNQSVTGIAWRSRQRQHCASYVTDPRVVVWRDVMKHLGIVSSLSIPIRGNDGQVMAVLTVYGAYPNQFESLLMQQFASGLQQRWEQIWQRYPSPLPTATITEPRPR